jgi:protein-S-isoprenylcysteine O-methyltransferase Ste14
VPDVAFRALGVSFFLGYVLLRVPDYHNRFWELGPWYASADGSFTLRLPWAAVLVDVSFLLVAISYLVRCSPQRRVASPTQIAVALMGGFWPMLPSLLLAGLGWFDPTTADAWQAALWRDSLNLPQVLALGALGIGGNLLDVWGYGVLMHSFSIVPEARELKTAGPYRWVRHPIYLGQLVAQAGVWLVYARLTWFAVTYFLAFVVIQLVRSIWEDRVLAEAFGEKYAAWKTNTFWFV